MEYIDRTERFRFRRLFADHRHLRNYLDACLDGQLGGFWVDRSDRPTSALAQAGYCFLGGDSSEAQALPLVSAIPPWCVTLVPDRNWHGLLEQVWNEKLAAHHGWSFKRIRLQRGHLDQLKNGLPNRFRIKPLDRFSAAQAVRQFGPLLFTYFNDPADFLARGFGYGVTHDAKLIGVSLTHLVFGRRVDVAVVTHEDYQRQGVAKAGCAALLAHCLERQYLPSWTACNLASQRLALALGYSAASPFRLCHC